MGATSIKSGSGLTGSGLGHPENMGAMGPGGNFKGRTSPQDIGRKTSSNAVGSNGVRGSNDGNPGVKPGQTGGQSRKNRGKVGSQKATGSK